MHPIQIDPEIMHGVPCFAGTRVQIKSLFDYLAAGRTIDTFLEHFPTVKREQVQAVLAISQQQLLGAAWKCCLMSAFLNHWDSTSSATTFSPSATWDGRAPETAHLLRRAAESGFEVLVTIDVGFAEEHDLTNLPIAVLLIEVGSDDFEVLIEAVPRVHDALEAIGPKRFVRVT
jgi:uncharacterized protein (DUF433 family)